MANKKQYEKFLKAAKKAGDKDAEIRFEEQLRSMAQSKLEDPSGRDKKEKDKTPDK